MCENRVDCEERERERERERGREGEGERESAQCIKSPSKRNGLLQIAHHLHLIECNLIEP
jgi:hypothetical protein